MLSGQVGRWPSKPCPNDRAALAPESPVVLVRPGSRQAWWSRAAAPTSGLGRPSLKVTATSIPSHTGPLTGGSWNPLSACSVTSSGRGPYRTWAAHERSPQAPTHPGRADAGGVRRRSLGGEGLAAARPWAGRLGATPVCGPLTLCAVLLTGRCVLTRVRAVHSVVCACGVQATTVKASGSGAWASGSNACARGSCASPRRVLGVGPAAALTEPPEQPGSQGSIDKKQSMKSSGRGSLPTRERRVRSGGLSPPRPLTHLLGSSQACLEPRTCSRPPGLEASYAPGLTGAQALLPLPRTCPCTWGRGVGLIQSSFKSLAPPSGLGGL